MLSEGIPCGTHSHHEYVLAVVAKWVRPSRVDRVPPRQQRDNLEPIRQPQHVRQNTGFDLRNIYRILLLKNARLHAVVADSMTGAGEHRIVDHYHRERPDRVAFTIELDHLRDFFVERTALEQDVKRIAIDGTVFLVHARGTGILAALVACQTVV